ncbi:ABC-2 transporter permease [Candidatus Epulonipiscium viviparus]|uniref:ABC-2 transporter permease n=1 Tax=Candidatus Epulonipiscium viviparus TaxID=420336 RepID=UPI0027381504|nr:ABC-2 transporter permease [Candidatus Epulopiscium viviparus]
MLGLLVKDVWYSWKKCKLAIGIIILMAVVSPYMFLALFQAVYMCSNIIAADEKNHWDKFSVMLPLTDFDHVFSKYLFGYLSLGFSIFFTAISLMILKYLGLNTIDDLMTSLMFMSILCLIYVAVTNAPLIIFGTEKAKAIILLMFAGFLGLMPLIPNINSYMATLNETKTSGTFLGLMFIGAVILNVISITVTVNFRRKKMIRYH